MVHAGPMIVQGVKREPTGITRQVSGAHTVWLLSPFTGQGKSFILQNYTWSVDSRVWRNRLCLLMRRGVTLQRCRHRKCEFFSVFQYNSFLLWAKLMSKLSLYLAASFTPQEFNRRYSEKNSAWVSMTFFSPKIYSQFGKNMSKINICYKSNMSFIIAKKEIPEKIILFTHW